MATRGRDQSFPNSPSFGHGASTRLAQSNPATPRKAVGSDHDMEKQKTLSSVPSANGLRTRRMMEELVAENSRLRAEVETIRSRQAETLEKMITDLVKTKSEIRVKDISLSDKQRVIDQQSTEMEHLRASQGSAQDSTQLQRATIEQLTTEVREKDLLLRERDQALRERDFEIRSTKSQLEQGQRQHERDTTEIQSLQQMVSSQDTTTKTRISSELEAERARAQDLLQELNQLKAAHATTLAQLDAANIRVQQHIYELTQARAAANEAAQAAINTEKGKTQECLQQLVQRTAAYSQLQSRFEAQEAHAQKLAQELRDLQVSQQRTVPESQSLEQLRASSTNDLAEARRVATFFKKNSEATSRKAKELEAEVKRLMESLQDR
ncbi:hypothetical protein LZ554_003262 [Drepanopeziza brunnea f. sp. 'monogermtubi']|nr:hypothetical protein LZ554_003262 [Drepanopeziza brunnea f. sp. 'monogermtubi']